MEYIVKGIISAEHACEHCGNKNLERNVVLADESGNLLYVGSDCAGKLLYGKKSASHTKLARGEAELVSKCRKLLESYTADEVRDYLKSRTCNGKLLADRMAALGL